MKVEYVKAIFNDCGFRFVGFDSLNMDELNPKNEFENY